MDEPIAVDPPRAFLTARWRHLAMLNYEVDPSCLRPHVPRGTELDAWQGRTLVSIVGFLFLDTRVRGWRIPFHADFEEVNLRFYVRRRAAREWRRGVVFIKEIVPRRAIAAVARFAYGENYVAMPMAHAVAADGSAARYSWRLEREQCVDVVATGAASAPAAGSEAEFITEHYWGYTSRRGRTLEYRVSHPSWRVRAAREARLDADVGGLYGAEFVESMTSPPGSAFLVDGSAVTVHRPVALPRD